MKSNDKAKAESRLKLEQDVAAMMELTAKINKTLLKMESIDTAKDLDSYHEFGVKTCRLQDWSTQLKEAINKMYKDETQRYDDRGGYNGGG